MKDEWIVNKPNDFREVHRIDTVRKTHQTKSISEIVYSEKQQIQQLPPRCQISLTVFIVRERSLVQLSEKMKIQKNHTEIHATFLWLSIHYIWYHNLKSLGYDYTNDSFYEVIIGDQIIIQSMSPKCLKHKKLNQPYIPFKREWLFTM